MPDPTISVLVPAYNEEQYLAPTLARVQASFAALGRLDYEIIVCDNNSTDTTAQIARAGGAQVVFEPHNSFSRARNAAARQARGQWLIFLDADTELRPDLLAATLAQMDNGQVGAGGALVRLDTQQPGWFGALFRWGWNQLSRVRNLAPGPYTFCRRTAWQQVDGYDEQFYYCEDIFFSKKLKRWCRQQGLRMIILSQPQVVTSARKLQWFTTGQLIRQFLRIFRPNAIKRREDLPVWYARPPAPPRRPETACSTPSDS